MTGGKRGKDLGSDVGREAVDELYRLLMIDEEWCAHRPRGFTWWSDSHAQHVEASELFAAPDGATGSTVRIWTETVADVPVDGRPELMEVIGLANMKAAMSAVVWDRDRAIIEEYTVASVYADTVDAFTRLLATAALFQNVASHSRATALAEIAGGRVASTSHPVNGARPERDALLGVPAQWAREHGSQPSAFGGELMLELGEFAREWNIIASVDETSFTGEVPYSSEQSGLQVAAGGGSLGTALVQAFADQPHPELGSGVLWLMRLPVSADPGDAAEIANELNLIEAHGGVPSKLIGAWCTHQGDIAYVAFLPSGLAQGGLLENLLLDSMLRARWVHDYFES